ncbi:unnamed protein product [Penicillium camemberti]|uniref:Str. FM013 n=1 Tax=Penicillium camemberti (strain FM 013) TaxID=1429867 RepID=A0A0G4P527_PENC3|nr:unnamed protein product [Penicillium camemberti]
MGKLRVTSFVFFLEFRPNDNMQRFTSARSINPRPKWCHIYHIWSGNTEYTLPRSLLVCSPHWERSRSEKCEESDGDMINIMVDRSEPFRRNAGFPTCI